MACVSIVDFNLEHNLRSKLSKRTWVKSGSAGAAENYVESCDCGLLEKLGNVARFMHLW
jgi:hypothetical protein